MKPYAVQDYCCCFFPHIHRMPINIGSLLYILVRSDKSGKAKQGIVWPTRRTWISHCSLERKGVHHLPAEDLGFVSQNKDYSNIMIYSNNLITFLLQSENSLLQHSKSLRTDLQNASEDIGLLFEKIGMTFIQIIGFLDFNWLWTLQNYYSYRDEA